MKKQWIFLFALSLWCFAGVPVHAQDVEIAVDNANAPFMYAQDGKAVGLYPAMVEKIFEKMGTGVSVKAYPWKRVLDLGAKGTAGIGGIYKNNERLKIFDYSDPIFSERLVLFINKEKNFEFSGIESLSGKKIGTILGWSYGPEFDKARKEKRFTVEDAKSDDINFKKLTQGWLDAVVVIELAGKKIVAKGNLQDKIVMASTPVAINDTYLVFAKAVDKKELLGQFNTALDAMKADGSYDSIVAGAISD